MEGKNNVTPGVKQRSSSSPPKLVLACHGRKRLASTLLGRDFLFHSPPPPLLRQTSTLPRTRARVSSRRDQGSPSRGGGGGPKNHEQHGVRTHALRPTRARPEQGSGWQGVTSTTNTGGGGQGQQQRNHPSTECGKGGRGGRGGKLHVLGPNSHLPWVFAAPLSFFSFFLFFCFVCCEEGFPGDNP